MDTSTLSVGFLGSGRMATALAAGFVRHGVCASRILAVDPSESARRTLTETVGGGVRSSADPALLAEADIVFLAVKPQVLPSAVEQLVGHLTSEQLIVSIAAGIRLDRLQQWLGEGTRIVRVMPNTPCLVGEGACGVSGGRTVTPGDLDRVTALLETVGIVEQIPESLMDAVTGLSGSGPAWAFQMIEALSDGGVRVGLPRDMATRLAAQTLLGAARMVLATGDHPGVLKDAVTSPGGTTIAGVHELESAGLRGTLMNAVRAATERSMELG